MERLEDAKPRCYLVGIYEESRGFERAIGAMP